MTIAPKLLEEEELHLDIDFKKHHIRLPKNKKWAVSFSAAFFLKTLKGNRIYKRKTCDEYYGVLLFMNLAHSSHWKMAWWTFFQTVDDKVKESWAPRSTTE